MGLRVRVLGAEERASQVVRTRLDRIDVVAARVQAVARSALGVLVAQPVAHREQHRGAGEVLARDQLEVGPLVDELTQDRVRDVGFHAGDGVERGGEADRLA